jgi:hypothetical protein
MSCRPEVDLVAGPENGVHTTGYQLDDEDRQALRSVDWSGSDEQLNQRVSKLSTRWC